MNTDLALQIIKSLVSCGIRDVCVCSGARNTPFISLLKQCHLITPYFWFEERSAAFFALGKSRATDSPVAVFTTSGTAVGELLPATMEAYYTGVPLVLVTADRPRRFRGSGAPQCADQVGVFGTYVIWDQDIEFGEASKLNEWDQRGPGHLNVCFEEPGRGGYEETLIFTDLTTSRPKAEGTYSTLQLDSFLKSVKCPQVIVGGLPEIARESVVRFLLELQAPVHLEAISGLREDLRLKSLKTPYVNKIWKMAEGVRYPIDGVLRLGSVPTARFWRDLEEKKPQLPVCSVSHLPYSGLSWAGVVYGPIEEILDQYRPCATIAGTAKQWIAMSQEVEKDVENLINALPKSEPGMIHQLSKKIPENSFIYLGNSMPIREWDLAATAEQRGLTIAASRGLNGIDGQLSTFLGMCSSERSNWVILGDLTTLYDMAAPWILNSLKDMNINIVVVNNNGGKIFERMFADVEIQNCHQLSFEHFAQLWGIEYERWETVPKEYHGKGVRLIELTPDAADSKRFWDDIACLSTLCTAS